MNASSNPPLEATPDGAALQISEARYRRLFETAQDGILILDATTGQVVDANPFMQVLLGYSLEEFVGKKLWEIGPFKGIEACKTAFAELQVKDSVRYESLPLERKSGGRVEAEFISNAYIAAQRRLIQCNIRDVTERMKMAEHSLRTQRLESIGMLAAGISHDLNNVLAPIGMVVSLLRTSITDPKDLRMLDILDRSADRGAGLVRQIIGFVHGVGGEPRVVQVKHLLNDVSEIIRETFPKSIIVEVQLVPDLWPVLANPTQIHQVLLNLSVNARDAMSAGGTLRLSAENCVLDAAAAQAIKGAAPGAWLMLQVEDTGTGIPPELLERIWEPFFTTKAAGEGTGLGLSTVRGIISASHGFMTLQTAMGRGTTVRAYLPVAPADAAGDSSSNPFPQERGNGELILIVDDEQSIRDMAGATLDHAGYRTVMATNGEEALAIFNEKSAEISLIITDLDMPRMGGVALARAIRVINPALKILAMGGFADRYTKEKPCDFASAFIAKPFTVAILVNQVQRLLHGVGSKPPIPLALPVGAGSPPAIAVTS